MNSIQTFENRFYSALLCVFELKREAKGNHCVHQYILLPLIESNSLSSSIQ